MVVDWIIIYVDVVVEVIGLFGSYCCIDEDVMVFDFNEFLVCLWEFVEKDVFVFESY